MIYCSVLVMASTWRISAMVTVLTLINIQEQPDEVTDKNEGGLKWAKRTSTNIAINVETRPPQVCSSTSPRA